MPAPVPKENVRKDIQRVAEKLGKVPTRNEYGEHGKYSEETPRAKFGSWTKAREVAGLHGGPTKNTYVPDGEILADIERVAKNIGESPSQEQYNKHGEYSHVLVYDRFGSWNHALSDRGLETERDERISSDQFLREIRRVAEIAGAPPSQNDINNHGQHGLTPIKRRFGDWSTAVRMAGFEPHTVGPECGENNPAWKGGYGPYYGPRWYPQRRRARERDGYQCRDCGMTDEEHREEYGWELEVHHIKPVREHDNPDDSNDLENLITLCRKNHRKYEELPATACKKLKE